jgi:hypothetical protein
MIAEKGKSSVATGLLNLAKTLNGTEEEEHEEDEEARKLSRAISARHKAQRAPHTSTASLRPTALEEEAAKDESSDFISMMPSSSSSSAVSSKKAKERTEQNFFDEVSSEEEEEDFFDDDEEEEVGESDGSQSTTSALASLAIEAVLSNGQHPAKMLQYLSTRDGQDIVLDKLEAGSMKKIHADHKRCSKDGAFDASSSSEASLGCDYFSGIRSEEQYKGLMELHSQLKHAVSDDAVSSIMAQCAEEAFNYITDVAINAYEKNASDKESPYGAISEHAATERDISKISDDDLKAITRNYQEVAAIASFGAKRSSAFAVWGNKALSSAKSETISEARSIVNNVINWLNDNKHGAKHEDDIYLGYQCAVSSLIALISHMPRNYNTDRDIARASMLAKKMLISITLSANSEADSNGYLDSELLNYNIVSRRGGGRGKRAKLKRFTRRVFKRVARFVTTNQEGFLKDMIGGCSNNYAERLANKRAEQYGTAIADDTKNDIAREMMDDYLTSRARSEAKTLHKAIRGLSLGVSQFDVFNMTMRVMAITASYFLTMKKKTYGGQSSSYAKKNLTDAGGFLPEAVALISNDVREYSVTRGVGKFAKRTGKQGKKAAKKLDKERKKRIDITRPTVVLKSHIPSRDLSSEDKMLESHERDFLRRAILSAIDYSEAAYAQELKSGKPWAGKQGPKSTLDKQYDFVVVIPEQRKFRNDSTKKVTTDHPYRWVFETPDPMDAFKRGDDVDTLQRPATHEVWVSLPPTDERDLSMDSGSRFRFRYYPRNNRLERMIRDSDDAPPTHSSYIDESGRVVRLKTKRDKKHIHVSDSFDPEDEVSDEMLAGLEVHVPSNVSITFRRSFG